MNSPSLKSKLSLPETFRTAAPPELNRRRFIQQTSVLAVGLDLPKRVTAIDGQYAYKGGREIPDIYNLLIEYPEGPTVYLLAGIANSVGQPMIIRGHQATVYPNRNPGAVIHLEEATKPNTDEIRSERARAGTVEEHYRNFFDCVKSRNKPRSNEQLALRVMTALNMGIHSYQTGRRWEYDAKSEKRRAV